MNGVIICIVNMKMDLSKLINNLVCFGASMIGGGSSEKIANALLKPFHFTKEESMDITRTNEKRPQVRKIINNINLIIGDVETNAGKPLLVVVDGLDKLPIIEQAIGKSEVQSPEREMWLHGITQIGQNPILLKTLETALKATIDK